jgi:ESCRT-II complex subunit VPS22
MCNAIGVDPLVISGGSTKKPGNKEGGSWRDVLGGGSAASVNDFYYELAVRVVEVCKSTRAENGGMMAVAEIAQRVQKGRGIGGGMEVSDDDVLRAVKSLEPLASGFKVMKLGSKQMVRSVPKELNTDQAIVLEVVQVLGYVTVSMLQVNLKWGRARSVAVIDDLVAGSLVWVDMQGEEMEFWTPTFIRESGV